MRSRGTAPWLGSVGAVRARHGCSGAQPSPHRSLRWRNGVGRRGTSSGPRAEDDRAVAELADPEEPTTITTTTTTTMTTNGQSGDSPKEEGARLPTLDSLRRPNASKTLLSTRKKKGEKIRFSAGKEGGIFFFLSSSSLRFPDGEGWA